MVKARRALFEADSDLCFWFVDGDVAASVGDSLVNECDLASNLGVLMVDSEGDFGGKWEVRVGR